MGMSAATQASLFQPFFRAAEARGIPGHGLGLALSRRLAQVLGGDLVLVSSAPGRGSTFRLTVPAPEPCGEVPKVESDRRRPARRDGQALAGLRLLVAEDHDDLRAALALLLGSAGAEVEMVTDGTAALAKMVSGPPLRQELAAVREATLRIEDNLVVEDNLAENLWYFYKLEDLMKVKLADIHQLNPITPESGARYRRVPYALSVTGSYAHVASFLRALETGPHLANMTFFSFKRKEPMGSTITLELNLELLGAK